MAWKDTPVDEAADLLAFCEAEFVAAELVLLWVALVDGTALGALFPTIGEGLLDVELLVVIGLAVPEPPVIEKNVEKMGLARFPLEVNRMAYCCVGERPLLGVKVRAVAVEGLATP